MSEHEEGVGDRNMKIDIIGIEIGTLWGFVLFNYALSSTSTFLIYSIALLATGFLAGSDLVFYYWNKEKNDEDRRHI